ncbi:MAG: biotin transporter BioY [Megasphaera sp.]|nr:biotin transporter BioY [Megasphaera sp.]
MQLHFVTEMPWAAVITSGVLPFIPLDIVKSILAAILAKPLLNIIAIRNTQP